MGHPQASKWSRSKTLTLTSHATHNHSPNPIAPGFVAPPPAAGLSFGPLALAAAVARTATTRDDASSTLLNALHVGTLLLLKTVLEDGPNFALSEHFSHLTDVERTLLAARIGAGITDLYMNALNYAWRANADFLSASGKPYPDLIYHGGNATPYGVVLAEAHGSLALNVSTQTIAGHAKRKYLRQVKPHLNKPSPFGKIVHGYSIAFGCSPGTSISYLGVSETKVKKTKKGLPTVQPLPSGSTPTVRTPAQLALSAHRSNFFLIGALGVVDWIDWSRLRRDVPETRPVELLRFEHAGRQYLTASPVANLRRLLYQAGLSGESPSFNPIFAIEKSACAAFLNYLSDFLGTEARGLPESFDLPTLKPEGFGISTAVLTATEDHALFRDGLALLNYDGSGSGFQISKWTPREGLQF